MYIHFGEGKCPLCGDLGQKQKKTKMLSCSSCMVEFDKFHLFANGGTGGKEKFRN
jgi:hypothetical protein